VPTDSAMVVLSELSERARLLIACWTISGSGPADPSTEENRVLTALGTKNNYIIHIMKQ